jgi:aminoglycoside 6'-N-acetyltransferase
MRESRDAVAAKRDNSPMLHGDRVTMRPIEEGDVDRLTEILGEPDVEQWWGRWDADRVRKEMIAEPEAVIFMIEANGEPIGLIQYYEEDDPYFRHAGVDLAVASAWQNQGYGTEALRVVARYLLEERGHHRLVIDPAVENERAVRAYERVGFRPVGVMRQYSLGPDGVWHDGLLMDLLAGELR